MPLQGDVMMAIGLTERNGVEVLRWRSHAIEYGQSDRVDVSNHPDYKGITVVKCYQANDENIMNDQPRKVPALAEAKKKDKHPRTFFISKVDPETYVATSRLGYDETKPVAIRRPQHPGNEPMLHIEMIDMKRDTTDDELLDAHLKRYKDLSREYTYGPNWPMDRFEADGVFLYMVSD
jgi:hypothetical protein